MSNRPLRGTTPVLVALILVSAAACRTRPDCASRDVFCVGLVTDRAGISDHGINEQTWNGIRALQDTGVVDHAAFIESMQAVDYSRNIGYFTGREYDLLVTTGSVLGRATEAAALDAPTTSFIGVDQHYKETHSNLATITIPYDQVGFLAGWLASYMSGTGTVAAVCETSELDSMRLICEGFHAGANSAQADIRALVRYRADRPDELLFSDHEWAASMTEGLIALGADVIFAAGGGTAEAALVAASKAQVYAIGAERDQWYFLREARPRLITSVYAAPSAVIGGLAGRVAAGGTVGTGAMAAITVGPLHDPEGQISPAMMNELQTLIMRFNAGELQSGVSPLRAD